MAETVKAHRLGPGSLKFGETRDAKEFSTHTSATEISPEIEDTDAIYLLDGGQYQDEGEVKGEISGKILQEYSTDSVLAWTWTNAGKVVPFEFVPVKGTIKVTGKCRIAPVKIGGDVKQLNEAEFKFSLTETPKISTAAA